LLVLIKRGLLSKKKLLKTNLVYRSAGIYRYVYKRSFQVRPLKWCTKLEAAILDTRREIVLLASSSAY